MLLPSSFCCSPFSRFQYVVCYLFIRQHWDYFTILFSLGTEPNCATTGPRICIIIQPACTLKYLLSISTPTLLFISKASLSSSYISFTPSPPREAIMANAVNAQVDVGTISLSGLSAFTSILTALPADNVPW